MLFKAVQSLNKNKVHSLLAYNFRHFSKTLKTDKYITLDESQ